MTRKIETLNEAVLEDIIGGEGGAGFDFVQVNGSDVADDSDGRDVLIGSSGNDLLIGGTGRGI